MQKMIVAACIFTSVTVCGGDCQLSYHGVLFTYQDWKDLKHLPQNNDDIILLKDGSKLYGKFEVLPPIYFSFAKVDFSVDEVALATFVKDDYRTKVQYVTWNGQNYVGSHKDGKIQFLHKTGSNNEYVLSTVDPLEISYIQFRDRGNDLHIQSPFAFSLEVENGDQFPIVPASQYITLSNGWKETQLPVKEILDVTFNGGLHGYLINGDGIRCMDFSLVKDRYFCVHFPKGKQTYRFPWSKIRSIQGSNGGFKHEMPILNPSTETSRFSSYAGVKKVAAAEENLLKEASGVLAFVPEAFDTYQQPISNPPKNDEATPPVNPEVKPQEESAPPPLKEDYSSNAVHHVPIEIVTGINYGEPIDIADSLGGMEVLTYSEPFVESAEMQEIQAKFFSAENMKLLFPDEEVKADIEALPQRYSTTRDFDDFSEIAFNEEPVAEVNVEDNVGIDQTIEEVEKDLDLIQEDEAQFTELKPLEDNELGINEVIQEVEDDLQTLIIDENAYPEGPEELNGDENIQQPAQGETDFESEAENTVKEPAPVNEEVVDEEESQSEEESDQDEEQVDEVVDEEEPTQDEEQPELVAEETVKTDEEPQSEEEQVDEVVDEEEPTQDEEQPELVAEEAVETDEEPQSEEEQVDEVVDEEEPTQDEEQPELVAEEAVETDEEPQQEEEQVDEIVDEEEPAQDEEQPEFVAEETIETEKEPQSEEEQVDEVVDEEEPAQDEEQLELVAEEAVETDEEPQSEEEQIEEVVDEEEPTQDEEQPEFVAEETIETEKEPQSEEEQVDEVVDEEEPTIDEEQPELVAEETIETDEEPQPEEEQVDEVVEEEPTQDEEQPELVAVEAVETEEEPQLEEEQVDEVVDEEEPVFIESGYAVEIPETDIQVIKENTFDYEELVFQPENIEINTTEDVLISILNEMFQNDDTFVSGAIWDAKGHAMEFEFNEIASNDNVQVANPKRKRGMLLVPPSGLIVAETYEASQHIPHEEGVKTIILPAASEPVMWLDSDSFYIDRYPITNAEYKKFVDETGYSYPHYWVNGEIPDGAENDPVVDIAYADAEAYAGWNGKRLPSEIEWQQAAYEQLFSIDPEFSEWVSKSSIVDNNVIAIPHDFKNPHLAISKIDGKTVIIPGKEVKHSTTFRCAKDAAQEHE